jgi:multiple sugar transport system permease protein
MITARDRRSRVSHLGVLGLLIVTVIVMLFPIYYMILVASDPDSSNVSQLWFHNFYLFQNIRTVMTDGTFPRFLLNSIIVSGSISILDVIIGGTAGYALARLHFPGRSALFGFVVGTLALSPIVTIIPLYIMLHDVGWLSSYKALIFPLMVSAFGVFLVRQFALGIPRQFLDAARLDGAGEVRILLQVVVPLLRPALLTLFLLQFLNQWDNLIWPLIVANDPSLWTVPVGLAGFQGEHGIQYHLVTAAALVSAIPPLILFGLLQRYYVRGLTLGGVKG